MIEIRVSFLLSFAAPMPKTASGFVGRAKIAYLIAPERALTEVEVLCWDVVARLTNASTVIHVKTVHRDGLVWVPVFVVHLLHFMSLEEAQLYKDHVIAFEVTASASAANVPSIDASRLAPGDVFFEFDDEEDLSERCVYRKEPLMRFVRNLLLQCMFVPEGNEMLTWLRSPTDYERYYDIVEAECTGARYRYRRCEVATPPPRKSAARQARKSVAQAPVEGVTFLVPAETLYTDQCISTYRHASPEGAMRRAFVSLSTDSVLSRDQKFKLNPFVVKITTLKYLPVETLARLNVDSIYVTYSIPYVGEFRTCNRPVEERVDFDDARVHFTTDAAALMKITEYVKMQRFVANIYGKRRLVEKELEWGLFGTEADDPDISRIKILEEQVEADVDEGKTDILLAIASYDLSPLMANVWNFREHSQCHVPSVLFPSVHAPIDNVNHQSVNAINLTPPEPPIYLTEAELLRLDTSLEVVAFFLAPQGATVILEHLPSTFKRMLFITDKADWAENLLTDIVSHNTGLLRSPDVDLDSDVLTGFVIDNFDEFIVFVEGPSNGYVLQLLRLVETDRVGRFFFTTDMDFERRYYAEFLRKGVYFVTLVMPLGKILSMPRLYVRGNVPRPCMQALKKIHLIANSSTFKKIQQMNLLPSTRELMSVNLEWGVPLMWKQKELKNMRSMMWNMF